MSVLNFMQVLALAGLLANWVIGARSVAGLRAEMAPKGAEPPRFAAWVAWPFFIGELRDKPGKGSPEVVQIERTLNLVVLFAILPVILGLAAQFLPGK